MGEFALPHHSKGQVTNPPGQFREQAGLASQLWGGSFRLVGDGWWLRRWKTRGLRRAQEGDGWIPMCLLECDHRARC